MRYKCSYDMHIRCSNSALCHLCDGNSLFHDPLFEKLRAEKEREIRKSKQKDAPIKTSSKERKKGMAFEQKVADRWNSYKKKEKKKVKKPRIEIPTDLQSETSVEVEQPAPISSPIKRPKEEARRQINSGAFWHSKGDIKLEHALIECKERGTTNSRGEKQITIQKAWLEKQEKEAFQERRDYWYLSFGFKGDDQIYLIKPFDHEVELIHELRRAREEIERLEARIRELEEGRQ